LPVLGLVTFGFLCELYSSAPDRTSASAANVGSIMLASASRVRDFFKKPRREIFRFRGIREINFNSDAIVASFELAWRTSHLAQRKNAS
jgi:hypothetical protein